MIEFKILPGQKRTIDKYLYPTEQYLSLTDIVRKFESERPRYLIQSWLRSKNTIEFLATWERENNPKFSELAYKQVLQQALKPSYTLTPKKWIDATNAIGLISKRGKFGGTLAQLNIACDFEMWADKKIRYTIIKNFMNSKVFIDNE